VRRSIELTPFGKDFCVMVLPVDAAEWDGAAPVLQGVEGGTAKT
jgi:hypothetical protein